MPDITMCHGLRCVVRDNCHRYTAKPDEIRQSYFVHTPMDEDGNCNHFWGNEDFKEKQRELLTDIMQADEESGLYDN